MFGCFAQEQKAKTGWDEDDLKGQVKSVKTTEYVAITKIDGDRLVIDKGEIITVGKNKKAEIVANYDSKGNKTNAQKTAGTVSNDSWLYGDVAGTKSYKYTTDGTLTDDVWKKANYFYTYRTTSNGAYLERNIYSDGNIQTEILRSYDANGRTLSDNGFSQKVVFKYDENGNKIEKTVTNKEGKVIYNYSYSYEYDSNKNWNKCIETFMGAPVRVTERTIEYY